ERESNPVLDIWEHLLEPALGEIVIKRKQKFGGDLVFKSYADLENNYLSGSVHPLDLKNGTASALYELFQPFQKACDSNPEHYAKLVSALS
ncbi:MAG: hypothetical protein VX898_01085, partial [Candidatus Thermoplasmatota archaeon]|nr:hypothetical protein [Candidatus Thermoplasmatota archaeon]